MATKERFTHLAMTANGWGAANSHFSALRKLVDTMGYRWTRNFGWIVYTFSAPSKVEVHPVHGEVYHESSIKTQRLSVFVWFGFVAVNGILILEDGVTVINKHDRRNREIRDEDE